MYLKKSKEVGIDIEAEVGDGRMVFVFPITFGRYRVGIGVGRNDFDDIW